MRFGNTSFLLLSALAVNSCEVGAAESWSGRSLRASPQIDEADVNPLSLLKEDVANVDGEAFRRYTEENARRLATMGEYHTPLPGNDNIFLENECFSSSLLTPVAGQPLIVPRGECFVVDSDTAWDLPDGLHIEGKLHVPSSSSFDLSTTFVFVMGVLKIDPPDEGKNVRVHLKGESEVTYTSDVGNLCESGCPVGSKGIVVLGGQLEIRGYPSACPSWEKLTNKLPDQGGFYSQLQVSTEAASCWKVGTELLLTSHTREDADKQFVTVTAYDSTTGILTVDPPVSPDTITVAQDATYAVEVASLSRPVLFEADSDATDGNIGGHLMVHHTSAPQHLEGVEIRNFGQLGRLGRYPIHFHMSGDHPNSVVAKNVVRDSNQRGYVVHLTNQVTLQDNVGVDIVGHCYFLEDGDEVENVFLRNLAVGVVVMSASIANALGAKNDQGAAAFWISNAGNSFNDNVAAGGENGYWFDTRGDLKRTDIISFDSNEAHSIRVAGLRTYNPGWRPLTTNTLTNFKVYRNFNMGVFIHVSQNMRFEGGVIADNGEQGVFISRSDNVEFDGTMFVGQSDVNPPRCRDFWHKVAISLHTGRFGEWTTDGSFRGTTLTNVDFINWSAEETGCSPGKSRPLGFNTDDIFVNQFSAPHVFTDVKMDASLTMDACPPSSEYGLDDIALEVASDAHLSFSPSGSPGFLVSPKVETMLDATLCESYNDCLSWCPGQCLRTVTVRTGDSPMPEDVVMVVTDDATGASITIERGMRAFDDIHKHDAFFGVALPAGTFTAKFISNSSGEVAWPGFAVPVFEHAPACGTYIQPGDLTFDIPSVARETCDSLIHNGDFESGLDGWAQTNSVGLNIVAGAGVLGSTAGATNGWSNSANWPFQYLDTSCLSAGDTYAIAVSYKLVDLETGGVYTECSSNCPQVGILHQGWDPSVGGYSAQVDDVISTTADFVESTGFVRTMGHWSATEEQAASDKVTFYIKTGSYDLIIDDVHIVKTTAVPSSAPSSAPSQGAAAYVLRTDLQGPACPAGLEVPEEECEAAGHAVRPDGMNLRNSAATINYSWTPCGCFLWQGGSQVRIYYDQGLEGCRDYHGRVVGMVCRSG